MPFILDDSYLNKKGTGSFAVSRIAIILLIKKQATALQIGAYLTLARYTSDDNQFSTASLKAIYNATGAGNMKGGTADRVVRELCNMSMPDLPRGSLMNLLYRADDWMKATNKSVPEIPHSRHRVHYVLNNFGDDQQVWFPNSLVDGVGKFYQPLKRLKQCGDIAARLLVLFYTNNNMSEFGGVPPFGNAHQTYKLEYMKTTNDFAFWVASSSGASANPEIILPVIGKNSFSKDENEKNIQLKAFWNALESLGSRGLCEEVITVMDGSPDLADSRPMYILSTRERHGKVDTSLDAVQINDRIMTTVIGSSCADSIGRFRDSFPVIVRAGIQPHVAGIYRLRFRINNSRNAEVTSSWSRMGAEAREHKNEMEYLAGQLDLKLAENDDFWYLF